MGPTYAQWTMLLPGPMSQCDLLPPSTTLLPGPVMIQLRPSAVLIALLPAPVQISTLPSPL